MNRIETRPPLQGLFPIGRAVFIGLLAALALYDLAYVAAWLAGPPRPAFGDFFGLWSFGRFAAAAGGKVYDPEALRRFQHGLDPSFVGAYPCPYPPTFLLALSPFGAAPIALAYLAWMATSFSLYLIAALGRGWRSLTGLALLVAPTSLLALVAGQNGFLSGALLVGGLRLLKARPILSGALFGLLTFKLQFGLLVPVVLLAARAWRSLASACVTVLLAAGAATAVFGPGVWAAWIGSASAYGRLLRANQAGLYHAMPTFMASFAQVGAPPAIAWIVQGLIIVGLVVLVWRLASRPWDERGMAASILATLIVTPYAFTYDLPMAAAAIALEAQRRARLGIPVTRIEAGLVCALMTVIVAMNTTSLPFVAPLLLAAILARIVKAAGPYPLSFTGAAPSA